MKRTLIILGSAVIIILLIIRMIVIKSAEEDDLRRQFVSKLNYNFSATVDSVAFFNPKAPVGYIYLRAAIDSVNIREKKISRTMKEGRRMRFFDAYKGNRLRMFSKDARLYKPGDSVYVATSEDRMRLFHERKLVKEFTISHEVVN